MKKGLRKIVFNVNQNKNRICCLDFPEQEGIKIKSLLSPSNHHNQHRPTPFNDGVKIFTSLMKKGFVEGDGNNGFNCGCEKYLFE